LTDFRNEVVGVACKNMLKKKSSFPPSAGDLYAECERVEDIHRRLRKGPISDTITMGELRLLGRIQEKSDNERERVAEMTEKLKKELEKSSLAQELAENPKKWRAPTKGQAQQWLEQDHPELREPVNVSDYLRRQLEGEIAIGGGSTGPRRL
jgi:hypothetical protein